MSNYVRSAVSIRAEPVLTFTVSEKAFMWLKALMQNPLYDDETEEERANRYEFFTAMHRVDASPLCKAFQELDDIPF